MLSEAAYGSLDKAALAPGGNGGTGGASMTDLTWLCDMLGCWRCGRCWYDEDKDEAIRSPPKEFSCGAGERSGRRGACFETAAASRWRRASSSLACSRSIFLLILLDDLRSVTCSVDLERRRKPSEGRRGPVAGLLALLPAVLPAVLLVVLVMPLESLGVRGREGRQACMAALVFSYTLPDFFFSLSCSIRSDGFRVPASWSVVALCDALGIYIQRPVSINERRQQRHRER